jgi:hypothetical protein
MANPGTISGTFSYDLTTQSVVSYDISVGSVAFFVGGVPYGCEYPVPNGCDSLMGGRCSLRATLPSVQNPLPRAYIFFPWMNFPI